MEIRKAKPTMQQDLNFRKTLQKKIKLVLNKVKPLNRQKQFKEYAEYATQVKKLLKIQLHGRLDLKTRRTKTGTRSYHLPNTFKVKD